MEVSNSFPVPFSLKNPLMSGALEAICEDAEDFKDATCE